MSYLYDFGEVIFCMGPVFLIIAAVGLTLLWNSWPSEKTEKEKNIGTGVKEQSHDNPE
ncbi:MAG TPA: hypothetical protein VGO43_15070 [Pyrinomonadaceae bacterium]|nr:hypothetical protein [Pyrinomonadaceae bacterium]